MHQIFVACERTDLNVRRAYTVTPREKDFFYGQQNQWK